MNIHQIATLANDNNIKTSKEAQYLALRELISSLDEEVMETVFPALVTLYKAHLPANIPKPKNAFDWVKKPMPKSEIRYYLLQVNVTEQRLVATDGHRLHIAPNTDHLAPGSYDKSKTQIVVDGKFPDIDRVIPSDMRERRGLILNNLINPPVLLVGKIPCATLREPKTLGSDDLGFHVNLKYLKDALSNPSPVISATISESWNGSLHLTFKDGSQAIVMSTRP